MAGSVQCPGCQNRYAVTPQLAGKMVKCKTCGQVMAIPAATRQPAMAGGGGLDYDLAGALQLTHEQTKIPVLAPPPPPENEHLGTAIGGAIVTLFATGLLAGIVIAVGKQIELGIVSIILGLICSIAGAALFVNKYPLGGFSTHAGWTLASVIGAVVTCYVVFTAPPPVPLQPGLTVQQIASVVRGLPAGTTYEQWRARALAQKHDAELRQALLAMGEDQEAARREFARQMAELQFEKNAAKKLPLVTTSNWTLKADPRSADKLPTLVAPEVIRFELPEYRAWLNCLQDDEFGTIATLRSGDWGDGGVSRGDILEQWDFATGRRVAKFNAREQNANWLKVATADGKKLFHLRPVDPVGNAQTLQAFDFATGKLLEEAPTAYTDGSELVLRGVGDSVIVCGMKQPATFFVHNGVTTPPRSLKFSEQFAAFSPTLPRCISPGGRYLVCRVDRTTKTPLDRWTFYAVDVVAGAIAGEFTVRAFTKPSIAFSPDGAELAVWCEEEDYRHSVAYINVEKGTVESHEGIVRIPKHQTQVVERPLQYLRSSTHIVYQQRYLVSRQDPTKTTELKLSNENCKILFGEYLAMLTSAGHSGAIQITKLEGLPE